MNPNKTTNWVRGIDFHICVHSPTLEENELTVSLWLNVHIAMATSAQLPNPLLLFRRKWSMACWLVYSIAFHHSCFHFICRAKHIPQNVMTNLSVVLRSHECGDLSLFLRGHFGRGFAQDSIHFFHVFIIWEDFDSKHENVHSKRRRKTASVWLSNTSRDSCKENRASQKPVALKPNWHVQKQSHCTQINHYMLIKHIDHRWTLYTCVPPYTHFHVFCLFSVYDLYFDLMLC